MEKSQKTYVVFNGKNPGVYKRWEKAHAQVDGFSGACYKGYRDKKEASRAFDEYMKPESEEYGSGGYGRKPESEEYGSSGYGRKPQSEEYGSGGYGRKPQSEEYGSGGYGRKTEYGEERVSYRRPSYETEGYEEKSGYKHHHHHKHYDD